MRIALKFVAAAVTALATGGCAVGWTANRPYPTYGNPVNPTPTPGYRVECTTVPQLGYPLFNNMTTSCDQLIAPDYLYYGEVVQTRG